ncbi:Chitinase [Helicobacter bizzozeronii CCUG 35545]|nr:Chitinase [Helicobacter bizzozeronii CCUG 35545]
MALKEHPALSAPTTTKATPKMAKKYHPQSKEELKKLVADESVHLGEIDISKITDLSYVFSHATGGGGVQRR